MLVSELLELLEDAPLDAKIVVNVKGPNGRHSIVSLNHCVVAGSPVWLFGKAVEPVPVESV